MRIRVIDLETTGFTPDEHAPCEACFIDLVATSDNLACEPAGWVFEREGAWGGLCSPGRPIPPQASAIHHIIDADVAGKTCWRDLVARIGRRQPLPRAYAAHNAKFERQWITDALTDGAPWICTYKCALRLWPDAPSHSNQALRYWLNLGVPRHIADQAHRAGPDALVTAHMLRRMLETPGVTIAQLIAWSAEPALLVHCRFGKYRDRKWAEIDDAGWLEWLLDRDFDDDVKHTAAHHLTRLRDAQQEPAQ